jgi:hypothetical protein
VPVVRDRTPLIMRGFQQLKTFNFCPSAHLTLPYFDLLPKRPPHTPANPAHRRNLIKLLTTPSTQHPTPATSNTSPRARRARTPHSQTQIKSTPSSNVLKVPENVCDLRDAIASPRNPPDPLQRRSDGRRNKTETKKLVRHLAGASR